MSVIPYGDPYEVPEARFLRFNDQGMSGSRRYRIPGWAYVEEGYYNSLGLPILGQSWSVYLPYLVVCDISCQEYGQEYVDISIEYSSDGMYSTDFCSTDLDLDITDLGFGPGWKWQTTNQPVEFTENYAAPAGRYTVSMKTPDFDKTRVLAAMNCVNYSAWHGFPPETLLFTGAKTSAKYSSTGSVTSVETVYSFEFKTYSHNLRYRQPVQVKDKYGHGYYYHNDSTATGAWANYYIANPADPRLYTPVWATTGGWEKPIIQAVDPVSGEAATIYLHTPIDFTAVLDIPQIYYPTPPAGGS